MAKPAKKIIIVNNMKVVPSVTDEFIDNSARLLETAITCILNSENPAVSLEELYRIVANLHGSPRRISLYTNLQLLLENALIQKLDDLINCDEEFLNTVNNLWQEFCKQVRTLRNIFLCFDRSSKNCKYNTVHSVCVNLFKSMLILNPQIKRKIADYILGLVQWERHGADINLNLLKSVISMLTDMQICEEVFLMDLLKVSETFYKEEGASLVKQYEVSKYLKGVNQRIIEEQTRAKNYLNKFFHHAILDIVYKYLISDHLVFILDKGFDDLVENNAIEDLRLMYNLLKNVVNGTKYLSDYFINYIMKHGNKIVTPGNEKNMIQELLDFKDKLDNIVLSSFKNNDTFCEVIRNSFVKFINYLQNRPAQLLAKYIDQKLKTKDLSDNELEVILNKVMILFRFIQGKDVFEAFYKKDLAKRLLLGKSTSQDAEDSMIAKLKLECGAGFTSKIEGMFKDIRVSQSINAAFKHHLSNLQSSTDLCINVLTSSFWPNYPSYEVNLPVELVNYQLTFQKFYSMNHSGRKLFWQPNLGHCVVRARFDCGIKELQVSLFQTLVLLMYNTCNKFTYNEIKESTNLEIAELKRTLMSLACGKTRVLLKQPKGKDIDEGDVFVFNNKFTDRLFRVRVNQVQLRETIEEEKATEKSVLIDRQFQIDAAIVRIMKKKKSINHNALLSKLFDFLDIPVKPCDLKKRIELLIEREYMERDKDNPANYTYIA